MKTNDLPIYKKTVDLCTMLYNMLKSVSRFGQITIGEVAMKRTIELIKYISLANREKDKREIHLNNFLSDFETLKAELRILYESENNLKKNILNISKLVVEIESDVTKWKNFKVDDKKENK